MLAKELCCAWTILLKCTVLGGSADISSLDFELTDLCMIEMCAGINPDNFCSDYSDILDSLAGDTSQNVLQEEQALENSCGLDVPALSNAVNTVGGNEDSSVSVSVSLPGTCTSSNSNTNSSPDSSVSSVQVQSSAGSAKRACDTAEKKNRKQKARKRQKTNTTTSTAAEANTALMNETKACMAVEKFNRCFRENTMVWIRLPPDMVGFAEDLAQRGLTSAHSSKIVELCMASKQWLGHDVFWRMLMFFVDTMSLELTDLNQLEDKKTVVLRNRTSKKPLSKCTAQYIRYSIAKFRGTERMEIQCSLNVLEGRGTADVLGVLKWLLFHVKIEYVGIICDLTEAGMPSKMIGRQIEDLIKEWKGNSVHIDTLTLCFKPAQGAAAARILKQCPSISVLKIRFIAAGLCQADNINQALKALLLHCPALEQLSVFGLDISIIHIQIVVSMFPQLALLEIESFVSDEDLWVQRKEMLPTFLGLKTLKISNIHRCSDIALEIFVGLFPSLKSVQISVSDVVSPLIDVLSKLRYLRSLEIINGTLSTETAEYLLDKLPALEYLSVGVKDLDNKLAHALSKCTGMHTLKLKGNYIPGFLASLLQPSPLMNTLKVLSLFRHSSHSYKRGKLSANDKHSKKVAMKTLDLQLR
ncbi:hypothetical protein NECID01_0352 [Nematocida sp. AWRm77]|nr:hypothetical protein NECID01_0352 [Nematocida sp. AWRm77]